jgi:hypothetical protein
MTDKKKDFVKEFSDAFSPAFSLPNTVDEALAVLDYFAKPNCYTYSKERAARVRDILYHARGTFVDESLKDHRIAQIVSDLRDVRVLFAGADQLRERIADIIVPILKDYQRLLDKEKE